MGIFNHFGRSNVWNSTHHGRYVFLTVFVEKYEHQHVHIHIHIHSYIQIHVHKYMYIFMCVYAVGWLVVGGVVWCGVVWCGVVWCVVVVVSLSLVFSNLKLVRPKGFFRSTSEARDITLCGKFLVSRKFAIRDEPNVRLRCSRNVKIH